MTLRRRICRWFREWWTTPSPDLVVSEQWRHEYLQSQRDDHY